jgi:NADPH2:quinone reductase
VKAIGIKEFGGIDKLAIIEVPKPKAAPNELLIEVVYTAVNPVDWKIREGYLKNWMPHEFPIILGWDVSGTVAAAGDGTHGFKVGDAIYAYCRKPVVQWGTYAEYVTFDANNVAKKPKSITFAQAAAIPLVGLTAWQAIFDDAKLKKGETILIHDGAGGVGSMAFQFAKHAGAYVYTTASKSNHDYVKKLGADVAIDYKTGFVNEIKKLVPQGLDVVLDCVGGQTLKDSAQLLKSGGRLVSIVDKPHDMEKKNIHASFVFVAPNGQQLAEIGRLIDEGVIIVPKIEEMPLKEAAAAQEKNREGHTQGKIVLKVK